MSGYCVVVHGGRFRSPDVVARYRSEADAVEHAGLLAETCRVWPWLSVRVEHREVAPPSFI